MSLGILGGFAIFQYRISSAIKVGNEILEKQEVLRKILQKAKVEKLVTADDEKIRLEIDALATEIAELKKDELQKRTFISLPGVVLRFRSPVQVDGTPSEDDDDGSTLSQEETKTDGTDSNSGFKIKNVITGEIDEVITPGSHNHDIPRHAIENTFDSLPWSRGATVRDLTSILCMLSSMGADVYAFRGWEGTMSNSTWIQVDSQLRKHGVKTDRYSSYMDHAISVSTMEEPWLDEFHPGIEVALRAMHVMVPILFEVEKNK